MTTRPVFAHIFTAVLVGCILVPAAHSQQIQISKTNRTVAITASDSASAMADVATVHIGFVEYGPDAQTAYSKGSAVSNAIAKALTGAGVAKDSLQSDSQNLTETQQYELEKLTPAEQAQRKFQLRQSWTVKTSAEAAAKVLNTAVNAGANQSGQIDWDVTDENGLQAEAAGKALSRARAIAAQMAQGLGIKLGDLIYASNQGQETVVPMMRAMSASAPKQVESAPLAINPRKVERSATVYAVFSIE